MSVFITTDAVGGVWRYSVALARGLAERGQHCTLAVLGPAPDEACRSEIAAMDGCTLLHTGLELEWTLADGPSLDCLVRSLIAIARDMRVSIAHLHAPALASLAWPMPVVAVAHSCMASWWNTVRGGPRPPEIAWHARATSAGLDRADIAVAPSHAFAAQLRAAYGPRRRIEVIHNGLPPVSQPENTRHPFILAAGRLWDESKNMIVLDRAASALRAGMISSGRALHGPGRHAGALRAYAPARHSFSDCAANSDGARVGLRQSRDL